MLIPKKSVDSFANQNVFSFNQCKSLKNNIERAHFSVKFKVMGGGGKIMTDRRWSWVVAAKLWLVLGGGDKIMACRGW